MATFRLTLLPAGDGDCLLLSWGADGALSHMVVDGGRVGAYPHLHTHLSRIAKAGEALELYVLTHFDADHVEGALAYLADKRRPIAPHDVWYNGYAQMRPADRRSMRQGDAYSAAIEKLRYPLNRHFVNGIASVEGGVGIIEVNGLQITMLSPDSQHLTKLGDRWSEWRRQEEDRQREDTRSAGRRERPPVPDPLVVEELIADGETDTELPNGSSIAFIAEWQGRRVLLAGDAHPDLLVSSLTPLAEVEGGRYRVDLLKASHHGSKKNISRQLVELLACKKLAISTNGNLHGHPDPEAIARFLHFGPRGVKDLYFNYETERTRPWAAPHVKDRYAYRTHFPTETPGELEINLM